MSYSKKETELLQQVEAIIPLISEASAASETLGKLRGDVLNALYEARVFHLFVPEVFGGNPIGLPAALEVFETISYADGATGWIVMIGAGGGLFSGFLEPSSAKEIFGAPTGVIAGSGMPRGRAIKTEGGYIVSGRWPYASGADHATTFTANCVIEGTDEILSIAVPAAQVTIHDTWHVFGMKATGSHDFSVESVYVKEAFTFDLFSTPKRDEPIYRCPLLPLASLTFGSVALGIARHALDLFMVYAGEKKRSGTDTTLLSDPNIQALVSKATEVIWGHRDAFYLLSEKVWRVLQQGGTIDALLLKEVDQYVRVLVEECVRTVDQLYHRAGMMPLFEGSAFGRAWRDLHTLSQHEIVAPG